MRVKKPTSKRVSTRMREGIKKKAAAQRRKNRKIAKKDVTWKSKHSKDPGIPSSFPYKDKIINELENQRIAEKEKKDLLKQQREMEREGTSSFEGLPDQVMDVDSENENGLTALMESAQKAAAEYDNRAEVFENVDNQEEDVEYEMEEVNFDGDIEHSRKAYNHIFKAVVEASDVILYVLDARDPEATRSRKVEEAVLQSQGKRLILILNKVDLIPPENLKQWIVFLKASFPTIPVKASAGSANSNSFNKKLSHSMTANTLLQALKSYASKSNLKRSIIVGVIGYPNVGKSSIINALSNRHSDSSRACPVGNQAGVTTSLREVRIDGKLKLLDSPGIVFPDELSSKKASKGDQQAKLALLSALPSKKITEPTKAVVLLLKKLLNNEEMAQGLKKYYDLPAIPANNIDDFTKFFLIHIARSRGRLGKHGIPDLESAASSVLNDWRDGRLLGWTTPNTSFAASIDKVSQNVSQRATRSKKEEPKVENTKVVTSWAKEFDLDGLLNDDFNLE